MEHWFDELIGTEPVNGCVLGWGGQDEGYVPLNLWNAIRGWFVDIFAVEDGQKYTPSVTWSETSVM